MMKNKNNSGLATLPTVFAIGVLLFALAVGLTAVSFSETIISFGQVQSSKALFYAEAGARDALIRVARDKTYSCVSASPDCYEIPFVSNGCTQNEGCARVSVSNDAGSSGSPKIIVSEGRVKDIRRTVEVTLVLDTDLNGEISTDTWRELTD